MTQATQTDKASEWSRTLKAARMASNVHQSELIEILGCSLPTYIAKEKDPSRFTLGEFASIYSRLNPMGQEHARCILGEMLQDVTDSPDIPGRKEN